MLQSFRVERADDEKLAQILQRIMFHNETIAQHQKFETELAESRGDDIVKAMKKYFSADNMLYIKAGDMAKAAEHHVAVSTTE